MAMTSIGRRNCLCTLMEDELGERDSRGHQNPVPTPRGKFWCEIVQLSGQELQTFQQLYPMATHRVTTTYTRSVKPRPDMWFEYDDRKLHIVGPPNNIDERNREWQFLCSEQVAVRTSDV